jgi:hypothetical protein
LDSEIRDQASFAALDLGDYPLELDHCETG